MSVGGRTLRVWGQVQEPFDWDWKVFDGLPRVEIAADAHAPRGGAGGAVRWSGISVREVLARLQLREEASFVMVHGEGDYRCGFSLAAFAAPGLLLADACDGNPLTAEQGGPLRLVVPGARFRKSVKGVSGIEFLNKPWPDSPGRRQAPGAGGPID